MFQMGYSLASLFLAELSKFLLETKPQALNETFIVEITFAVHDLFKGQNVGVFLLHTFFFN